MESGFGFAPEDDRRWLGTLSHQGLLLLDVVLCLTVGVEPQSCNCFILLRGFIKIASIVDGHPFFIVDNSSTNKVLIGFGIFNLLSIECIKRDIDVYRVYLKNAFCAIALNCLLFNAESWRATNA